MADKDKTTQGTANDGDVLWWIGVVLLGVGWWLGPALARSVSWLEFLGGRGLRLWLLTFGMLMISGALGAQAQAAWSADQAWSPRVIGNALGSLAAGLATLFLFAIWVFDLDLLIVG
jgi:hypothetical protein